MKKETKLKISMIIRTVMLVLTYINQIMAIICQQIGVTDTTVYMWISAILTIIITIITYWYNNDWSSLAKLTGKVFDMCKDGKITTEEITSLIEKHEDDTESSELKD